MLRRQLANTKANQTLEIARKKKKIRNGGLARNQQHACADLFTPHPDPVSLYTRHPSCAPSIAVVRALHACWKAP